MSSFSASLADTHFVRAAALHIHSRFPSSHPQAIVCSGIIEPDSCSARSAIPEPDSPEVNLALSAKYADLRPKVPDTYHVYLDVFSKSNGTTLSLRRPYDHKIDLEPGTTSLFGLIYPLSEVEQFALRKLFDENLANQFIRPSQSPAGAPIQFIKKKDGSLCLSVDYRGLNKITKKGRHLSR